MIVMKFGGSSLADADHIRIVAENIRKNIQNSPVIVISAFGNTTNRLIETGQNAANGTAEFTDIRAEFEEIARDLGLYTGNQSWDILWQDLSLTLANIVKMGYVPDNLKAELLAIGERLSVIIIAEFLTSTGVRAKAHDAWDVGIVFENVINGQCDIEHFTNFNGVKETICNLIEEENHVPIITGFIAKDTNNQVVTLGRNGSDRTAAIIGAALEADEIQYWKDVNGILTADPRVIQDALPVSEISFQEAVELSCFGSEILHPKSIQPARDNNIPVSIRNSHNPNYSGTRVVHQLTDPDPQLRAITFKRDVTLVDICSLDMYGQYGFLAKIFQVFNDLRLSVNLMATSEVSVSLSLDDAHSLGELKTRLGSFSQVKIHDEKAIISLIGNVSKSTWIINKTFKVLNQADIDVLMISQGMSRANISFVVEDSEAENCVGLLHRELFSEKEDNVNVFKKDISEIQ